MRLSEINAEQAIDVLGAIIVPLANIAVDPKMEDLFNPTLTNIKDKVQMNIDVLNHWKKRIPDLLKNHKEDVIEILASLNLMSAKEYKEKKNFISVTFDLLSLFNDPEIKLLFTSAQSKGTKKSSGSVQENTEVKA